MSITEILAIISLVFSLIILIAAVVIIFLVVSKKGNGEQQNLQVLSQTLQQLLEQQIGGIEKQMSNSDDNLLRSIGIYNEAMVQAIKNSADFSKMSQSDLDRRFSEFINNMEIKLANMRNEITEGMTKVRKENEQQLTQMRETVDEKLTSTLNDRISKSFNIISERLEAVSRGLGEMRSLSDGVVSLNKVLSNVKTRGSWGELSLDNILMQILTPEQYCSQADIGEGKSKNKVDFAVLLPGQKGEKVYLPIDAKFPLEDYEKLVDASELGDKAAVDAASKALAARIKEEAKSISEKYIKPPYTTDFAILYLPIEGLFAEVVRSAGLCDELQNRYRVVLCGPTTITALLNSLQIGFKTLAIQQRSSEIWKLLAAFKLDFAKFADLLSKTQTQMDTVTKTIKNANSRTASIQKKLDKVQMLVPEEEHEHLTESAEEELF